MADFEVKIENLNELKEALRSYPKISEPILQKAVEYTGAILAKYTEKNNPVPFRTGRLLQSFSYSTGRLTGKWGPRVYYAPFVEFGTRPHLIMPRNAKVLAWETSGGGKYVTSASGKSYYKAGKGTMHFAAYVNHPGTKAQPFMEKIVERSIGDINKVFRQALDLINKKVAEQINKK
jgi:HK97 gp10 family phage protein